MDNCWSIPLLSSASILLLAIPSTCFGIIFVLIMEAYGATREQAAWPESIFIMTGHLSGLSIALLQRHISLYRIIVLSAVVTAAAISASAFAPSMVWMVITLGALHGFALKVFFTTASIYSLHYFTKYQTTAQSFINSSWSTAGTVGPMILSYLMHEFGFKGALLISGAIIAHGIPLSMLLKRPLAIRFPCCRKKTASSNDTSKIAISYLDGARNQEVIGQPANKQLYPAPKCPCEKPPAALSCTTASADPEIHSISMACAKCENSCTSRHQGGQADFTNHSIKKDMQTKEGLLQQLVDLSRKPAFYVLVLANMAGDYSDSAFLATIVDYGRDKGIEFEIAMKLTTFSALGRTLGSTVLPALADAVQRSRSPLYVTSFAVSSACLLYMPQVTDLVCVATLTAVNGLAMGYLQCARYLVIAENVGVGRTATCFGMSGLGIIPLCLANASIIGYFRDAQGSYDNFYRIIGAIYLFIAVLFALFYYCIERNKRKNSLQSVNICFLEDSQNRRDSS